MAAEIAVEEVNKDNFNSGTSELAVMRFFIVPVVNFHFIQSLMAAAILWTLSTRLQRQVMSNLASKAIGLVFVDMANGQRELCSFSGSPRYR